jgi:hypothetical protein
MDSSEVNTDDIMVIEDLEQPNGMLKKILPLKFEIFAAKKDNKICTFTVKIKFLGYLFVKV